MGISSFLIFLLSSSFFALIHANTCPASSCTKKGLKIHFPFRIKDDQPIICGYPGFNLKCSDHGPPFLSIPGSGDFLVRNINYLAQQIELYDSNNCLPGRFLSSDLPSLLSSPFSPFKALQYQNYTFLSCPKEVVRPWSPVIECLSNSTNSALATSSVGVVGVMINQKCQVYATKAIPVSRIVEYEVDWFSTDLSSDLHLKWDVPDSRSCEAGGLTGGFKSYKSQEIFCYPPDQGAMDVGYEPGPVAYYIFMFFYAFLPVVLTLSLPFLFCIARLCIWAEARKRSRFATNVASEAGNDQPNSSLELQDIEDHTEADIDITSASEETPLIAN